MTAISYMSDIKLYTQPTSPEAVPLDHLGQHARFAIRARMLRALVDMALQNYDRWWVVAHSLGSVVAFSGLATPGGLIARYLNEARWRRLEGIGHRLVCRDPARVPDDTRVPCPAWLEPDACIEREAPFEHFGRPRHLRLASRQVRHALAGGDPEHSRPAGLRPRDMTQLLRRDRSGRRPPGRLR